jgi:hypothetical protein
MKIYKDYHLNPKVLLKWIACHFMMLDEYCHRCGDQVRVVWWADQQLWDEVMGTGEAGVRCVECFIRECLEHGIATQWEVK